MQTVWLWITAQEDNIGQQVQSVWKHLSSTHYTNMFPTVPAASVFVTGALQCIQTGTDLTSLASFSLLFAPIFFLASLKLSALQCT